MKLTCYVVDDEPLAVELMEGYVRKTPFLELKGSFYSASATFEALGREAVDLLFCDIQMPELSGMELARMLPERTRVIFTTAFSNYAVEGFRVNALDYLLKPISYADFLVSASKALRWFEMAGSSVAPGKDGHPSGTVSSISPGPLRACALADEHEGAGGAASTGAFREGAPLVHHPAVRDVLHREGKSGLREGEDTGVRHLPSGTSGFSGEKLHHTIGRTRSAGRSAGRS